MLDEQQEAPTEEPVDVADAGGDDASDDAVDLADMGASVETADEPAVTAEELMEIPDAPEMPGRTADELTHMLADAPADTGEPATDDASALGAQAAEEDAAEDDAAEDDAADEDAAEDGDS